MKKEKIKFGEYQLCPKCLGKGYVNSEMYHYQYQYTSFNPTLSIVCDVCLGAKIIQKPIIKNNNE